MNEQTELIRLSEEDVMMIHNGVRGITDYVAKAEGLEFRPYARYGDEETTIKMVSIGWTQPEWEDESKRYKFAIGPIINKEGSERAGILVFIKTQDVNLWRAVLNPQETKG